jgi:large subunit ribosomal protein L25
MKRLRQAGNIPAMLYGHGEDNVMLAVSSKELNRVINHGSHIVELKGAANESALIKDVQWDAFGIDVVHVDFTRVDPNELVEVTLPIVLKGDAIGTHHGGEIAFHQHQITISCPAIAVPDKIELRISKLDIDQSISASEVPLPEGAVVAEDGATPIVSCNTKAAEVEEEEETAAAPEAAE